MIIQGWNGIEFAKPLARTRDVELFLRAALAGEKVGEQYETFSVEGFRLGLEVEEPPPVLIAALRSRMLELSGTAGDGTILNWLSAEDVKTVVPYVKRGGEDKDARTKIASGRERSRAARSAAT